MCSVLASSLAMLLWAGPTMSQTDQPNANLKAQRQPPQRPSVFFPMAEQPEMEMHHHGQIPEVMPQFPRLGNSQRTVSGPIYQLEDLERMASANNPTIKQARRALEAAQALKLQVGLYPNPVVGYNGEEIRGGSYGGGEQGFFVEQPVILGGKLGLNRKIRAAEEDERRAEADAQRQRVENDVRMAYYRVLAAQERLALKRDILAIAQSTVRIFSQLGKVGQADETEILEAETEEHRVEIDTGVAEHMLQREWVMLVSVVGVPTLPQGGVAGRIDADLPPLDQDQLLTSLLGESPEIRSSQASVQRAEAALRRAKHEPIPDLLLKGGLQQNFESLAASANRKVGLQGFAEIGVLLHLWDRNQGGIAAERAGLEAAHDEVKRVDLMLRNRFAIYGEDYGSARLTADKYRSEILPRLEHAYKLMTEQYGLMTASFLRVLLLQRMLYENETAYVDALERTWTTSVALRGFLLEGALRSPNSGDMETSTGGMETQRPVGSDTRMLRAPSGLNPN
jgi:cobalt-zinc-cadmium efflux system outer membrane protein